MKGTPFGLIYTLATGYSPPPPHSDGEGFFIRISIGQFYGGDLDFSTQALRTDTARRRERLLLTISASFDRSVPGKMRMTTCVAGCKCVITRVQSLGCLARFVYSGACLLTLQHLARVDYGGTVFSSVSLTGPPCSTKPSDLYFLHGSA